MRGCGKRREKRRRERENKRNDEEWREKEILPGTLFSVALLSAENPFLTGSVSLSFSLFLHSISHAGCPRRYIVREDSRSAEPSESLSPGRSKDVWRLHMY